MFCQYFFVLFDLFVNYFMYFSAHFLLLFIALSTQLPSHKNFTVSDIHLHFHLYRPEIIWSLLFYFYQLLGRYFSVVNVQ